MSDTFLHAEKPPHEPRALHAAKMVNASHGMRTNQSERTHLLSFRSSSSTTFTLRISAAGRFAIYTQHVPSEFSAKSFETPVGLELGPIVTLTHGALGDHGHATEHGHKGSDPLAAAALAFALLAMVLVIAQYVHHRQHVHPLMSARMSSHAEIKLERPLAQASDMKDNRMEMNAISPDMHKV